MREIFFNSFKEKILRGEVDSHIIASGIPMSNEFLDTYDTDDISIEQYRNLEDFNRFSKGNGAKEFEKTKFQYDTFGVDYQNYYDDDLSEKPIFVNSDNSAKFLKVYGSEMLYDKSTYVKDKIDKYLSSDDININSGFYYVTKKSHLNWIAKRVNDDYNFNNRIVVVLGDDIGTANETSGTAFESVIGANPNKPFQGIFDLNGHAVNNLNLLCKKNSNGIIGYLGTNGIVRDGVVLNPRFTGLNKISLEKIKNDCSDVVCGTLVGTNYGTVENIITSGNMRIMGGFCPEVYVAGNKGEYQAGMNTYEENNYTNAFFPSKFCINSIYNVIPYVGYFCEGADCYFNDAVDPIVEEGSGDVIDRWKQVTRTNIDLKLGIDNNSSYSKIPFNNVSAYNLDHYMEGKLSNNSHFDLNDVALTKVIPDAAKPTSGNHDQLSSNPDTIWYGFWNKESTGNTYLADIYREHKYSILGVGSSTKSIYYLRPLITMSVDQILPDRLMKNTVKSIGKFVDFEGNELYSLDQDTSYMQQYADYAANLAHQLRDQIVMYYSSINGGPYAHYTTHQKMNPYSRIAYYLSPIVGNNFGTIQNIDCRHTIYESEYTFVGFIGNVCGKENNGDISNCYVDLDIVGVSGDSKLETRDYIDTNDYLPDYELTNSAYSNLVNLFGYNYDYFQSPYGLNQSDMAEYSAVSADCIKVTPRFYEFEDIGPSAVMEKIGSFIFNKERHETYLSHKRSRHRLANFVLRDDKYASELAQYIPENIRKQKMTIRFENVLSEELDTTGPNDYALVIRLDSVRMNRKASYKFYNPYYKDERDNWHDIIYGDQYNNLINAFTDTLYDYKIKHMDLNYLGDAAKTVMRNDVWKGAPSFTNAAGESYKVTIADILDYCPDFNGDLGTTEENAKNFCRNMMDAKVALGYDMLGNQTFSVTYQYPGYDHPFGGDNPGLFGTTNYKSSGSFIIPSGQGPNDTSGDWNLGGNLIDMAWYMPPASNEYPDNDGPVAYDPSVSIMGNGIYVNSLANYNGGFCSVQPYGLWDLYGNPKNKDAKLFEENRDISKPSIGRSMLSVELKAPVNAIAENLTKVIMDNDPDIGRVINRNRVAGSDLKCQINKIFVPIANRTNHSVWQGATFCGDSAYSGLYITDKSKKMLYDQSLTPVTEITDDYIGNLDVMYVDMSIGVNVNKFVEDDDIVRYETYPVIVEVPIEKIFVPISCIHDDGTFSSTVNEVSNPQMSSKVNEEHNITKRSVDYFFLTPAYDILDPDNSQVEYKLKSIYNIGGIAGMINHSQKYIDHGFYKFDGKLPSDHAKTNVAKCGSITNCNVFITQRTNQFVVDLQASRSKNDNDTGNLIDKDPKTIGVANKIGGVAAIYEYRQNDMGTSPASEIVAASTDGLQRFRFQKFGFTMINVGGEESTYGYNVFPEGTDDYKKQKAYLSLRSDNRIFSPFIDWANVSNMLDTTNFFAYKEIYGIYTNPSYMSHHSSNFPIDGNPMLYTAWMQQPWDTIGNGEKTPKPLIAQTDTVMLSNLYPIGNKPAVNSDDWKDMSSYDPRYFVYLETMNRYGSTSAEKDVCPYYNYSERRGWTTYPRIGMNKYYEWIPNSLIDCFDVFLYASKQYDTFELSMSPMADSPCSDYNDVYLQMFNGSPNFVDKKLSKAIIKADIPVKFISDLHRHKIVDQETRTEYPANCFGKVKDVIEVYNMRADQYRNKYFTWDYETSGMKRDPLMFDIIYKKPKGHSRGLWIHQLGEYDTYEVLRYAMKGGDYGKNDGACLHLGYLPSDKAVVEILNYDGFGVSALPHTDQSNPEINNRFEEGHAISGYGFNGMLLVDTSTNDLICYIDTENDHDFDLGCWVAPLSEKIEVDDRAYGLLTEIVAENSPKVEQDPNDNTDVTIVENVYYVDNTPESVSAPVIQENTYYVDNSPQNIEPTTVTIQENTYYVDNTPKSI